MNGQMFCTWSPYVFSTTNQNILPKNSACEIESSFSVGGHQSHLRKLYQDLDLSRLSSSGLHRLEILARAGDSEGPVSDGIMTCTGAHTEGKWNRQKAGCLSPLATQDRNRILYVYSNADKPRSAPGDDPNDPRKYKELDSTPEDAIDADTTDVAKQTFGEPSEDDEQEPLTLPVNRARRCFHPNCIDIVCIRYILLYLLD
jgi:hypothetical protein